MSLLPGEGNPVCKFYDPFSESIMQAFAEASSFLTGVLWSISSSIFSSICGVVLMMSYVPYFFLSY